MGYIMFKAPEKYRLKNHSIFGTDKNDGNNGVFYIPIENNVVLQVIASEGEGWEHVSVVAIENKQFETPVWDEMCVVKDLFWGEEDCVIQYHPPKSEYVNNNEHCLHLWRKIGYDFPRPENILVGIKYTKLMFTTPCFIRKNTPGIRKNLEELGYRFTSIFQEVIGSPDNTYRGNHIKSYPNGKYITTDSEPKHPDFIDCGEDEKLFLALAALRGDSDIRQLFKIVRENAATGEHVEEFKLSNTDVFEPDAIAYTNIVIWGKATLEEIIEHFKNKSNSRKK